MADANAILARLRKLAPEIYDSFDDVDDFVENFQRLDSHLSSEGGKLPDAWKRAARD